jgi:hypothetical protein
MEISEQSSEVKRQKTKMDKRGMEYREVTFRCPVALFDVLEQAAIREESPLGRTIVRHLKKGFGVK